MRKIFLHIAVSIDGFIQTSDNSLDWQFVDDDFEEYVNTVLRSIDTMIFGRVSFELLAQYWPTAAENPAAAVDPSNPARHIEAAHMMDSLQKIAVSKTMKKTDWNNSRIVSDTAELEKLKAEPGRDIALFAGGNLASSLMRLGLIDEYRLLIYPALLGGGTPLFQGGYGVSHLKLIESRIFASGAVLLTYRPLTAA